MKQKNQITVKKRTAKIARSLSSKKVKNAVKLVHANRPGLKHFRLVEHKHTFKLIHHRHTSHALLMLMLVFVGFFMMVNQVFVRAETVSQSILVGAIVPGPPPTKGAVITDPVSDARLVGDAVTKISGTCEQNSFVVVKDNGLVVGSTSCSADGKFSLQIQLLYGRNDLTALNYDNMNQVGPVTSTVTVYLSEYTSTPVVEIPQEIIPPEVIKAIPDNPSIITGVSKLNECGDYNPGELPTGGPPRISIVCVPRLFFPGINQQLGIIAWGGQPPYAVSINWGKVTGDSTKGDEDTLISLDSPGYHLVSFNYAVPDTYRVTMRLTDKESEQAVIETAIQVNGQSNTTTTTTLINEITNGEWFKTPVPLYVLAVGVTLGFWGGDLFDRKLGTRNIRHKAKKRRTV